MRWKYGVFALLCIIAALLWILWDANTHEKQVAFFASALERTQVFVKQDASLAHLKTEYARTLARRAPILGVAGTDPDKLERAIAELEQAMEKLVAVQTNPEDKQIIEALYPLSFLKSLAELERHRLAFVASGTAAEGELYAAHLSATLREYERALAAFATHLERLTTDLRTIRLVGLAGQTTPERMLAVLAELESGAGRAKDEHARRERCLSGSIDNCGANDIALPYVATVPTEGARRTVPPSVRAVEAVRATALERPDTGHIYVELNESACLPRGPRIVRIETEQDDPRYPSLLYAEDIFLARTENLPVAVLQNFRERGVEHAIVSPFNYYICAETGTALGRAWAIANIAVFAREYPDNTPDKRAALLGDIVAEGDAVAYVNGLLADTSPNAERVDEFARMLIDRSARLDALVRAIAYVTETDLGLAASGAPFDLTPQHLYLTHSAFPSLFLAQNPLSGAQTSLYEPIAQHQDKMPIEPYSKVRNSVPRDALLKDMRAYLELERRL